MIFLPKFLKNFIKKSNFLMSTWEKLLWQIHLLKDFWGTKIWTKTIEVTTPLGFKLSSGYHPAYELMRNGQFEKEETALILSLLKQSDVFIDVGANLGYYSCLARLNNNHVVAFEPQQQNLRSLMKNILSNNWHDKVEVFPLALGDASGIMTLYGASGPSASFIKSWAGYSSYFQQLVPVSTLDIILNNRFEDKQLFIKVDVEGAEYQVLMGALKTIGAKIKPVWLLEICLHEFHPEGANPDFSKIFELFWKNNYQAFTATEQPKLVTKINIEEWVASGKTTIGTFNYLFLPSEHFLRK